VRGVRLGSALVSAMVCVAMLAGAASAATVAVDTSADPAAPDCASGHAAGTCSLRGAVAAAPVGDTVVIPAGVNPVLTTGEIAITQDLTIEGQAARATTVSGNDASRIFNVTAGTVSISGLALTGGRATGGGALYNDQGGNLSLTDVAVIGNKAETPSGNALGGGIINRGTLALLRVTVSGNSAAATAAGQTGAAGGGIANGGTLTATNVTISDDTASGPGSLSVTGGGLYTYGSATLTNATLASNTVTATGSGAGSGGNITTTGVGATVTLKNTLVAYGTAATGSNCLTGPGGASFISQGGNLEATTPSQCGLSGPPTGSDLIGVDPLLGPLADNGGQTNTRTLGDGSPAIDAVPAANCPPPADDQRLVARPQGSLCDIGALERQAVPSPPPVNGPEVPGPVATAPEATAPEATGPQVTGPEGNPLGLPSNRHCVDRRRFSFRLHHPEASRIVDVKVYINGKRTRHLRARSINRLTLRRLPKKRFRLKIVATQNTGSQLISVRTYRGCKKSRPHTRRGHR
jgi:hypothetical protein